jgi:protein gp37
VGAVTEIGWCDHTFNPWIGCARVSPGCRFCYAEALDKRWGNSAWGSKGVRRRTSEANWKQPRTWNRRAAAAGIPMRVFSASLADVFEDHEMLAPIRADLFHLIEATPWLRWMLLTKRIGLVQEMTALAWGEDWPTNVWIGTSMEDQRRVDERLPVLLSLKGPAERFVSAEPLLEPITVAEHIATAPNKLSLLIGGGESGPHARYDRLVEAARTLRDESASLDVPFSWKQWGEHVECAQMTAQTRELVSAKHDLTRPHKDPHRVGKTKAGRLLDGVTHDGVVASYAAEVGLATLTRAA